MNRSKRALTHLGMAAAGGRPSCPTCGALLEFGTDGQGRTTERCDCGYRGYLLVRLDREPPTIPE